MNAYYDAVEKAKRHGWKVVGVTILGNCAYTTLHRWESGITIAIHPITARMFKV